MAPGITDIQANPVAPGVAARVPVLAGQAAMVAMGVALAVLVVTVAMAATVPSSIRS
jgi:hypothetical protein